MGKLKKLFVNISETMKEVYKKFPITITIVYIVTFLCTFGTDEFLDKFMDDFWFLLLALWGMGTLLVEVVFSKKIYKIVGSAASLGIAALFRTFAVDSSGEGSFLDRVYMTYILIIPILTIYAMIKKSKLELHEYGKNLIYNLGKCSIIYLFANIGVAIVLAVFIELILDGEDFDIIPRTLIVLLGGYYIPSLINAFTDMKQEAGKFIKVLVCYVFTPIVSILIGILYLYILKITIKGELLKNSIFFILSLTFCAVAPISLLLKNYTENKTLNKLSKVLVYLFIPFIILQIIAMGIRVSDYGLTESRYMGYILVVFEIIYIVLALVKESKYITESILVGAGLIIVLLLSPLNYIKVPIMSQTARIENLIEKTGSFDELEDKDKNECKSAYTFLVRNDGKEYLENKIDKETIQKIDNYIPIQEDDDEETYKEYVRVSIYDTIDGVDVTNYSKIYEMMSVYYTRSELENISNIGVKDRNNQIKLNIDIENMVQDMIQAELANRSEEEFEKYRLMETNNEKYDIYIKNLYIRYEMYSKQIESIDIDGFILEK